MNTLMFTTTADCTKLPPAPISGEPGSTTSTATTATNSTNSPAVTFIARRSTAVSRMAGAGSPSSSEGANSGRLARTSSTTRVINPASTTDDTAEKKYVATGVTTYPGSTVFAAAAVSDDR